MEISRFLIGGNKFKLVVDKALVEWYPIRGLREERKTRTVPKLDQLEYKQNICSKEGLTSI